MLLEEPALVLHCFKLCFSRRFESSLLVVQIHLSLLPLDAFVEPSVLADFITECWKILLLNFCECECSKWGFKPALLVGELRRVCNGATS